MVSIENMAYRGCLAGETSMLKPCGKGAGAAHKQYATAIHVLPLSAQAEHQIATAT